MLDPLKVAFINFVLQKYEMRQKMTRIPEAVFFGTCRCSFAVYDVACEKAAREKMQQANLEFKKTPELSLALAEFYKFGHSEKLPFRASSVDLRASAYWYIQAAECGSSDAFLFLDRMVPEFFIENMSPITVWNKVKQALEEQAKVATPGTSIEDRKKEESVVNFVIDQLLFPDEKDLDVAIRNTLQLLQEVAKKAEQYLTFDKKN